MAAVDTDSNFFKQAGICVQCGMEGSLEVTCEVCAQTCNIADVTIFMRYYVCQNCKIEDLLHSVHVTCQKCGKTVKLFKACEYRGKHACRECGIKMLKGDVLEGENVKTKATPRFLKWLGL